LQGNRSGGGLPCLAIPTMMMHYKIDSRSHTSSRARRIFQQRMQAAHGVAMASSTTKITNAAIWYYCTASHWFVRESWLWHVLLTTGRLDSLSF
jgi:hypothetical protein